MKKFSALLMVLLLLTTSVGLSFATGESDTNVNVSVTEEGAGNFLTDNWIVLLIGALLLIILVFAVSGRSRR